MSSSRLLELGVGAGLLFFGYTMYEKKYSQGVMPNGTNTVGWGMSSEQYQNKGGQTAPEVQQGTDDHIGEQGNSIPVGLIDPNDPGPTVDTKLPDGFYMPEDATTLSDLNAVTAAQITNQTGDTFNVSDYGVYNQQGQQIGYYDAVKNKTCYTLVEDSGLAVGGDTCYDGFVDMNPRNITVMDSATAWQYLSGASSITDAYNNYKDNLFGCLFTEKGDGGCSAANLNGAVQPGLSNISLMPQVYVADQVTQRLDPIPWSDAATMCQGGYATDAYGNKAPCLILDPSSTSTGAQGATVTDPQFDIFDPSEWADYVVNTKVTANQSDQQLLQQFLLCQGGDDQTCANVEKAFGDLNFSFEESYAEYTGNQNNVIPLQMTVDAPSLFSWSGNWEFASPSGQPTTPSQYANMLAKQWQS